MFVTVDFLITLEDTVAGTSTHEVVVTLTRGETTTHSRPCLATTFTALEKKVHLIIFLHFILHIHYSLSVDTYHEPAPGNSTVNMQQSSFDFLHFCWPHAAVHMSPFILSNIQQPTSILHIQYNSTESNRILIPEHRTARGFTYIRFGISMLLTEGALSFIHERLRVHILQICGSWTQINKIRYKQDTNKMRTWAIKIKTQCAYLEILSESFLGSAL